MPHVPADYELTIRPTRGWFHLDLAEIWRYRDLLFLLVNRDFVAKYKQTILGPLWFIIQPLMMTVVFTIIFGKVAGIPTDGLPPMLFYLAGVLGWSYFAQTLQSTSATLVANAGIFDKVYFPRLVVPLSSVISNLLAFAIQLATFVCFWGWFKFFTAAGAGFGITGAIVWFPLLVVQIAALSLGVGLWLSALTAKYRDFTFLSAFIIQIWMYATPVIYSLSQIPPKWQWLAVANPMAMPVEAIRFMFLGQGVVVPAYFAVSIAMTAGLVVTGVLLFNKVEKTFVDTV
jgi:lipopolysaccharide transport system permease protein